jgi:hypothetical protein
MKKTYKIYPPGSSIWWISRMNDSDGNSTDYVAIYESMILSVNIKADDTSDGNRIEYEIYGHADKVDENSISNSFEELCNKMKSEWCISNKINKEIG